MLLAYLYTILFLQMLNPQSCAQLSARELDSVLQDYAFRAFIRPKTGIIFNGNVPTNLSGVQIAGMRLRSGSLRRRGVRNYKEFDIPIGVIEQPYVERLVLVYHNLGNLSSSFYPLPGHHFLTPVLGILAYDAYNLSAIGLSELDIRASDKPISIKFPSLKFRTEGKQFPAKCVTFDLDGSLDFDEVVNGSICLTRKQGHFSIVVESIAPAPAPASSPAGGGGGGGGGRGKQKVGIIVGSVIGGAILLVLVCVLFGCVQRFRERKRMERMEEEAERGIALPMARIGGYTRAPIAPDTRTRPLLENEFVV